MRTNLETILKSKGIEYDDHWKVSSMAEILGLPDGMGEDMIIVQGAAGILDPACRKEVASRLGCKIKDLYILPSSIWEVIVINKANIDDSAGLLDIVKQVNRTQVSPEEQLADNVFEVVKGKVVSVF